MTQEVLEARVKLLELMLKKQSESVERLDKMLTATTNALVQYISVDCNAELCTVYDHCSKETFSTDYCLINIIGYCLTWEDIYKYDNTVLAKSFKKIFERYGSEIKNWEDVDVSKILSEFKPAEN